MFPVFSSLPTYEMPTKTLKDNFFHPTSPDQALPSTTSKANVASSAEAVGASSHLEGSAVTRESEALQKVCTVKPS